METANRIAETLGLFGLAIALLMTFLVYAVWRKPDELGRHAAQNTAATLMVYGANIAFVSSYFREINAFTQNLYNGLGIPTLPADFWDGVPFWIVAVIGIVARDFVDYWNHRLMHTRWFWPTHAAHHSDTHVNAFTSYRVHFLEALVVLTSYILLLTWMQMPHVLPVVVLFSSLHNKYVHLNLPFEHGPLKYLIASPAFHRWHHADTPVAYGKNLANVMPLWDKLFGSYYYPGPCKEQMGALSSGISDKNPVSIFFFPVFEWARLIRETAGNLSRAAAAGAPEQGNIPEGEDASSA